MTSRSEQGSAIPQGDYVAARRYGQVIYTAGMTPRENGVLKSFGPIRKAEAPEIHRDAVVLACRNCLAAARTTLNKGESIGGILAMTVYIMAEEGFTAHSRLADFASRFLQDELGESGVTSRCAVGVASLPGGAPVEIQLVAVV